MKLERTLDRVVISAEELQQIVKTHVEKSLGRTVEGRINFHESRKSDTEGYQTTGWCQLADDPGITCSTPDTTFIPLK
jgi:hypothetical protein